MDQIIDGRRAAPPAVELNRLADRTFDIVRGRRLTTRATRVLAAAGAYTSQAAGVLGWAGTLGEDRTVTDAVGQLGVFASDGIAEQSTLGWNRAEVLARQVARHLIATVRAAMAGDAAEFMQTLGEVGILFDRLDDALAIMPAATELPALEARVAGR